MTYEEMMAGADALNAYYRADIEDDLYETSLAAASVVYNVVHSYKQLLSDYAEQAGCYCEWEARVYDGLEEEA